MGRKGQIGKKIDTAVVLIVSVVVLFLVFAGIVPEAQTAGETMSLSSRCTAVGCIFNETTASNSGFEGDCAINSSAERTACTDPLGQGIPLSGLFSGSGIVILLLMVFLFLGVLKMVLPGKSKK